MAFDIENGFHSVCGLDPFTYIPVSYNANNSFKFITKRAHLLLSIRRFVFGQRKTPAIPKEFVCECDFDKSFSVVHRCRPDSYQFDNKFINIFVYTIREFVFKPLLRKYKTLALRFLANGDDDIRCIYQEEESQWTTNGNCVSACECFRDCDK